MWWLLACVSQPGHPVRGVVVQVTADDEVILDHEEIPGFMGAMTMPFHVQDESLLKGLQPGHVVKARLEIGEQGGFLTRIDVVGKGPAPEAPAAAPGPLRKGQQLPATPVQLEDGSTLTIGKGQSGPMAVTFIYTRCPMPDFCPATVAKFQALQAQLPTGAGLLAVTIDPAFDSPEVLSAFRTQNQVEWHFGRVDDLDALALSAGLTILPKDGEILHAKRVLILGPEGKLRARYDDLSFPLTDALELLR